MQVNYTHQTSASQAIIKKLEKIGVALPNKAKQIIIDEIYNYMVDYSEADNGCNCGQVACPFCGG